MTENRKIIFSFDDGPAPVGALKLILPLLKKNDIKAEFYVLGSEVKKYPGAARLIVTQGHKIQNHSWSHPNLAKASEDKVRFELEKTQQIIKQETGTTSSRVRPPYGAGGWKKKDPELARVAKSLSLSIHNWDIDTEDWKAPRGIGLTKIEMINKQLKRKQKTGILNVLMHVQDETANDLQSFIDHLKELGFTFAAPLN
jgi:peptidoglycan/xylan/chitin deacetylase (PgdA/CDA1 family)